MSSVLAPIVLFAYDRLNHVRLTVECLAANNLADRSELIVYSDAAADENKVKEVAAVRDYLKTIKGFLSLKVYERERNFGLARSVIEGVSETLATFNKVIVVEDDLMTSPYFLSYMNQALEKYSLVERVASVHAYLLPTSISLPETFFMRGADCWGWGTWRRSWGLFNPDGQYLYSELKKLDLISAFDLNNCVANSKMLLDQIKGKNNSWAIRWHASTFIANKLTLYPGRSLVRNIGLDDSGTHCQATNSYDTLLTETSIDLADIVVEPSVLGISAFTKFYTENKKKNENWRMQLLRSTKLKSLRKFIEQWIPPVLLSFTKKVLLPKPLPNTRFEGTYRSWNDALNAAGDGYADNNILEKVLQAALLVKQGRLAFERDSVGFAKAEHSWPMLSVLMTASAINKGKLNVLDFGGSLGSKYFQCKFFLDALEKVTWNVVEQQHFVRTGQKHLQTNNLRFYETVEGCVAEGPPDVVLLSSVLQYLQDPIFILQKLLALNSSFVILDRTCFYNEFDRDMVTIQHVPPSIYSAQFPCRFLNEHEIVTLFELAGYQLLDRISTDEQLDRRATWVCCLFFKNQ